MVHGVRLVDGEAKWYRNRYVRSNAVSQRLGEPRPRGLARRRLRREHPCDLPRGPDARAGRGGLAAVRADRRARHRRPDRLRRHAADGPPARRLLGPPARGPRDRGAARGVLQLAARQPGRLHGAGHRRPHPQDGAGAGRRQPDDARLRADRELRRALRPAGGLRQAAGARRDAAGGTHPGTADAVGDRRPQPAARPRHRPDRARVRPRATSSRCRTPGTPTTRRGWACSRARAARTTCAGSTSTRASCSTP